jgi:Domain of unknown function (DUF4124)
MESIMRIALLFLSSCIISNHSVATVYKWVDDKGVTQYTETPPPFKPTTEVRIMPAPAANAAAQNYSKEAEFQKRRSEAQEAAAAATRQAATRKDAQQRCAQAKQNLEVLRSPKAVYPDNKDGKSAPFKEEAREDLIKKTKDDIATHC